MWYGSGTTAVKRQTGPEPTSADLHPLDVAPDLVPGDRLEQGPQTSLAFGRFDVTGEYKCVQSVYGGAHTVVMGKPSLAPASTVRPSLPSLLAVEGTDYGISGKTFEKTLHSLVEFGIIDVFSQCKVGE
ncbi:hypothetical protein BKA70DRAFT_1225698 [Coprinopsis sp. MPI-PUGE-AT-0042]|nr:hypothetical protein BKA70DRAFT_1225698 [Coprinopsis sp. MPI-PUGE-AT-0042]